MVTNIANSLKSRSLEVRDNARKALVEIIKILGPHFLFNILKETEHILILGYLEKSKIFIRSLIRISKTCAKLHDLCAFGRNY